MEQIEEIMTLENFETDSASFVETVMADCHLIQIGETTPVRNKRSLSPSIGPREVKKSTQSYISLAEQTDMQLYTAGSSDH